MTDPNETFRTLHRHAGFLRRLARSLVRDPNVADDVEQHTWHAALTRPPRRTSKPREWLATVARNFLRSQERTTERRRRREQVAARPERVVASPSERLEREELLRQVLDSVLSLEEPYRETLLLRFYEGLSPRAVAKRQDVPLETVRTRLRRGLALVRTELDRRNGGERSTWSIALIAAAGIKPGWHFVPRWEGTKEWAMRHSLEIALTATAATVIGVLATFPQLLPELGGSEELGAPRIETTAPGSAEVTEPGAARASRLEPLSGESASPMASMRPSTSTRRAPGKGGGSSFSTSNDEPAFLMSGRVVTPDGNPAAGIPVRFSAQTDNEWHDREESMTGSDGRFEYSLSALPDRVTLRVRAAAHGFADIAGDWHPGRPDSLRDLGDLRLQPAGTLIVTCVDAEGFPIEAHWRVETEGLPYISRGFYSGGKRVRVRMTSSPRDGSGVARLTGVPVGEARIDFELAGHRQWQTVEVLPGEQNVEIHYGGPDLSQRLTINVSARSSISPEALHLIGPVTRAAEQLERNLFAFEPLPAGAYTVELRDERFLPAHLDDVSPGYAIHRLKTVPNAGVRISARDASTQTPIADFVVRRSEVVETRPDAEGVYRLLPGEDPEIVVAAEGYVDTEVEVPPLAPGEVRTLTVELGRPASISGRLVDPEGNALEKTRVALYRPAEVDDSPQSPYRPPEYFPSAGVDLRTRVGIAAATSAEDGTFHFEGVEAGRYIVRAEPYVGTGMATSPIDVPAGEDVSGIEIVTTRGAWLEGRLTGDSEVFPYLLVWVVHAAWREDRSLGTTPVNADGTFRIGPLPPGTAPVRLKLRFDGQGAGDFFPGDYRALGEVRLEAGKTARCQLEVPESFPAFLTVSPRVNGEPVENLEITVIHKWTGPVGDKMTYSPGDVLTDESGDTPRVALFPTGRYEILVAPLSHDWVRSVEIELSPGESRDVEIPIELIDKTLRFIDADTDQPLRWAPVLLMGRARKGSTTTCYTETNRDGEVTLSLPLGTYRACRTEERDWDTAVEVEWAASGPSPTVVRVR